MVLLRVEVVLCLGPHACLVLLNKVHKDGGLRLRLSSCPRAGDVTLEQSLSRVTDALGVCLNVPTYTYT